MHFFPSFMGPKPVGRLLYYDLLEGMEIFFGDPAWFEVIRIIHQGDDPDAVKPPSLSPYIQVYHRISIASCMLFGAMKTGCLTAEEVDPVSLFYIGGMLIGYHQEETNLMGQLPECFGGLIDGTHQGAVFGPVLPQKAVDVFIGHGFVKSYRQMVELQAASQSAPFPIGIVGRHTDHALTLLI